MSTDPARRSTSNTNDRGSSANRRSRRLWLVREFPANVSVLMLTYADGLSYPRLVRPTDPQDESTTLLLHSRQVEAGELIIEQLEACRCYRCGKLQTADEVSPDRYPILGVDGGTYRRGNIRPACLACNVETGSAVGHARRRAKVTKLSSRRTSDG